MNEIDIESIEKYLREIGIGRRNPHDPFFSDSHEKCKVFRRTGVTVEDEEELCHEVIQEFQCSAPRCKATFRNLIDYEIHYNGAHRYTCQQCKTTRPNPRLLDIHIQETHDSFFHVLSQKQAMYQCYVTECQEKFSDSAERKAHCVAIHKFPKNFRYDSSGRRKGNSDTKNAMEVEQLPARDEKPSIKPAIYLNKNQKVKTFVKSKIPSKVPSPETRMETGETQNIVQTSNIQAPVASKSCLAFIPRQVNQRLYAKALTKNCQSEKNVLESDTLMDLAESLPD